MKRHLCFVVLLLFAIQAKASSLVENIRQHYLPSEYDTLLVGDEDMPVFAAEPTTPLSRGVALIFLDNGHQGLTLHNAQMLAMQLNQRGWHTRILPSDTVQWNINPLAPSDMTDALHSRASNTAFKVDFSSSESSLSLWINAAFDSSANIPGFRLVIAQGMTGAQLVSLTAKGSIPNADSLVLLDAFWPDKDINAQLTEKIAQIDIPIIDLHTAHVYQAISLLSSRQRAVNKTLKLYYRQKTLSGVNPITLSNSTSALASNLDKEIYGWTRYLGW
ncbi:DUF3530 family protein [Alteromonas sp. 14N.309.X.WAT.G.H12]|uniref:DUF3530 family protein n=1 Tax=Alteromonas sp. 14N.309.X.WAT.G.H12 TaxID=3120824 RepID=UPI002FD243A1